MWLWPQLSSWSCGYSLLHNLRNIFFIWNWHWHWHKQKWGRAFKGHVPVDVTLEYCRLASPVEHLNIHSDIWLNQLGSRGLRGLFPNVFKWKRLEMTFSQCLLKKKPTHAYIRLGLWWNLVHSYNTITLQVHAGGGGFFLACGDFERTFDIHFPASLFLSFSFEVEISLCTLIPLFYARISPQWVSKLRWLWLYVPW